MNLTIELPDEIAESVCREAEMHGTTTKNLIEGIITRMHELRVKLPREAAHAELDRLEANGEIQSITRYLPMGSNKGA
ncbi:MAG: hypothetical protein WCP07_01665 [bacterium]